MGIIADKYNEIFNAVPFKDDPIAYPAKEQYRNTGETRARTYNAILEIENLIDTKQEDLEARLSNNPEDPDGTKIAQIQALKRLKLLILGDVSQEFNTLEKVYNYITNELANRYLKTEVYNKSETYNKQEIDNQHSAMIYELDWKESVETFEDIAITYPNPEKGWNVGVSKPKSTIYRYDGTDWVNILEDVFNTMASDTDDGLMSSSDFTKLKGLKTGAEYTIELDSKVSKTQSIIGGNGITSNGSFVDGNVTISVDNNVFTTSNKGGDLNLLPTKDKSNLVNAIIELSKTSPSELLDNKLDKGTYPGNASDLKSEIDKIASKTTLGRIIVGDNLTVDSNGRMSGNPAVDISGKLDKGNVPVKYNTAEKIGIELDKKQNSSDFGLNTNAKTVAGAINELNDNKLDKGTYPGNAGDLKSEIDGKVSKSGGTITGPIDVQGTHNANSYYSRGTIVSAGAITSSDNVTAYSDKRLKKNIRPLHDCLELISKLDVYRYYWKENGKKDIGVIAQEVEEVFPEFVIEVQDETKGTVKTVDYAKLATISLKGIKELLGIVEDLRDRVETLERGGVVK